MPEPSESPHRKIAAVLTAQNTVFRNVAGLYAALEEQIMLAQNGVTAEGDDGSADGIIGNHKAAYQSFQRSAKAWAEITKELSRLQNTDRPEAVKRIRDRIGNYAVAVQGNMESAQLQLREVINTISDRKEALHARLEEEVRPYDMPEDDPGAALHEESPQEEILHHKMAALEVMGRDAVLLCSFQQEAVQHAATLSGYFPAPAIELD